MSSAHCGGEVRARAGRRAEDEGGARFQRGFRLTVPGNSSSPQSASCRGSVVTHEDARARVVVPLDRGHDLARQGVLGRRDLVVRASPHRAGVVRLGRRVAQRLLARVGAQAVQRRAVVGRAASDRRVEVEGERGLHRRTLRRRVVVDRGHKVLCLGGGGMRGIGKNDGARIRRKSGGGARNGRRAQSREAKRNAPGQTPSSTTWPPSESSGWRRRGRRGRPQRTAGEKKRGRAGGAGGGGESGAEHITTNAATKLIKRERRMIARSVAKNRRKDAKPRRGAVRAGGWRVLRAGEGEERSPRVSPANDAPAGSSEAKR